MRQRWFENPTRLMTVRLDGSRSISDSVLSNDTRTATQGKIALDYEVLRTLIVTPSFQVVHSDYEVDDLDDLRFIAGLQAEYAMNRYLSLGARYKYEYRDFDGTVPAPASHAVDDGRGEEVLRADGQKPAEHAYFDLAMRLPDGAFKGDATAFDLVAQAVFLLFEGGLQLIFERSDLIG